jgi:hypothetical protein
LRGTHQLTVRKYSVISPCSRRQGERDRVTQRTKYATLSSDNPADAHVPPEDEEVPLPKIEGMCFSVRTLNTNAQLLL